MRALYCSIRCSSAAQTNRIKASATPQPCAHCHKPFKPRGKQNIYCSHHCATEAMRTLKDISCAHCGVMFRPNCHTTQYCSLSCVAKDKHDMGKLRHFPRKLNAKRLDQVFKDMRRKRPYRQRLTPARLDAMLERVARAA